MRIALIKSQSRYGALRIFIDELAAAVRARGDEAVVLDLSSFMLGDLADRLIAAGPLDLVFSFNTCGDYRDRSGRTIREATGAAQVVQFVDHPLHHMVRLKATAPDTAVLFVDRSHVRTVHKLLGPKRFAVADFNPHAALGSPAPVPSTADAFAAERPIEVLFAGTLYRPQKPQWDEFPSEVRAAFAAAAEAALSCEWLPALDALDAVLTQCGLDPQGTGEPQEVKDELLGLREAAILIHDWVRAHRRASLLEAAAQGGLPLTVIGEGQSGALANYSNIKCLEPVEFRPALDLMRQARLVLNANANFGEGSHERPLSAMMAGAAAASDTSTFYQHEFDDGRDIILFHWTDLARGVARIKDLVSDTRALFERARAGQEAVLARHTWKQRVETILAAGKAVAA